MEGHRVAFPAHPLAVASFKLQNQGLREKKKKKKRCLRSLSRSHWLPACLQETLKRNNMGEWQFWRGQAARRSPGRAGKALRVPGATVVLGQGSAAADGGSAPRQHPIPLGASCRIRERCHPCGSRIPSQSRTPVPRYNEPLYEGREVIPNEPPAEPRDKSDTDLPLTAPVIKMPVYWKHMEYL